MRSLKPLAAVMSALALGGCVVTASPDPYIVQPSPYLASPAPQVTVIGGGYYPAAPVVYGAWRGGYWGGRPYYGPGPYPYRPGWRPGPYRAPVPVPVPRPVPRGPYQGR